nr:haloacid dehalogenase-like hydrolase [uncultured Dysosmobacter sp.]
MSNREYHREPKEDRPVVAICYDFDKTLSPDDMQAQGYIQSVGYDVADFWIESNGLAQDNDMDQNLAYMYKMIEKARGRVLFTQKNLRDYGSKVSLFPGVEDWFQRIRAYGADHGVIVEHYIISSGLREMIEGTSVARSGAFKRIYASSFYYDRDGVACWPAQVVNYTNKTQFLFRIEKGVLDINDPCVNDSFSPEEMRVPFRNMIYIGDSDTDIPCMKLVTAYGGHSIGVYNADTGDKAKVYKMMRDGRVRYYAPADYSEGTELDTLVKAILRRTAANEELESLHYIYKRECAEADRRSSAEERRKTDLLIALENSRTFATTHSVIAELQTVDAWTPEERETLLETALKNSQVYYILRDSDLSAFYRRLLGEVQPLSANAEAVREVLEQGEG